MTDPGAGGPEYRVRPSFRTGTAPSACRYPAAVSNDGSREPITRVTAGGITRVLGMYWCTEPSKEGIPSP